MGLIPRLVAMIRADVPVEAFDSIRDAGVDAYELVDALPRGPARLAAWNAYVLQTYADKLIEASKTRQYVRVDTAQLAERLYHLAGASVERAREAGANGARQPARTSLSDPLPRWHTPVRRQEQLAGMRATLDALRIYVSFDVRSFHEDDPSIRTFRELLTAIDARVDTVDGLWIPRANAELRGGIGDALAEGLDLAYALGQSLARPDR
jgi:hypothetical protein